MGYSGLSTPSVGVGVWGSGSSGVNPPTPMLDRTFPVRLWISESQEGPEGASRMLPLLLEKVARQLDLAAAAGVAHLKGAAGAGRDTVALAHSDDGMQATKSTTTTGTTTASTPATATATASPRLQRLL